MSDGAVLIAIITDGDAVQLEVVRGVEDEQRTRESCASVPDALVRAYAIYLGIVENGKP